MRKLILLFACIGFNIIFSSAQNPEVLNKYNSVFVPPLLYGNNKPDIYGIREVAIERLSGCGVPVFLKEEEIHRNAMKNPCSMLHCLINNKPSPDGKNISIVVVLFLDCRNDTVLKCAARANVLSTAMETRLSFMTATKEALQFLNDYHHQYADSSSGLSLMDTLTADGDSILWSPERKLAWEDFKGAPIDNDPADALTYSSNQTHFEGFGIGNRFEVESEVKCYFIKTKSWVKPAQKIPYLLNHEQRHFDLAEVGAREFRKKLKGANFTAKNFSDETKRITEEINEKYFKLQKQYDSETNHSRIEEKQAEWNAKIDSMLKEWEAFK